MQNSRELSSALTVQVQTLRTAESLSLWPTPSAQGFKGGSTDQWLLVTTFNPKISSPAELCLVPAREAAPSPSANMTNKGDTLSDIQTICMVKLLLMTVSINQWQKFSHHVTLLQLQSKKNSGKAGLDPVNA